ncbi:efflux RND transporter periplasmic adaptor subunit [Lacunimicrobium album]
MCLSVSLKPQCLVVLVILMITTAAYGHEGHQPLPTKGVQIDLKAGHLTLSRSARDVLDVRTVEVRTGQVDAGVRAYATIVAPWTHHAFVASRLSGKVVTLHVRPGDVVKQGQVLAEIDSLDLQTLQLDYQQAVNDLELSQKLLASVTPAALVGAVPGNQLAEAENTHQLNQNTLEVLRAKAAGLQVEEARLAFSEDPAANSPRLKIISPISGVVVHADIAVGKFVEPTEHLFEIVDTSKVWARIGVLESDLHRVQVDQSVRLVFNAAPGLEIEARIDTVGSMLDPLTHQATAWATINNSKSPFRLLPGMTGQARFQAMNRPEGAVVPTSSVFSDGAERYVFVEEASTKESSEYRKKPVVVGRQTLELAQLVAGDVYPGDRVVTRGGHELSSLFLLGVLRLSPQTARSIGLSVESVSRHSVEQILAVDGAVDIPPQRRTTASSQLQGSIHAIRVGRGQEVKSGDILADIVSLELQDLQLQLIKAHLDHELWENLLNRLQGAKEAVSKRTVLETQGRVKTLYTQYLNLQQKLRSLGLSAAQVRDIVETRQIVETLPVRAPIDGVVVEFDQVLGQVIRADESLFEIHNLSQARIQAYVSEQDTSRLQVGQSARIRLVSKPDVELTGTVERVGPVLGAESRTQAAWITLQPPEEFRLQHNMLTRVHLTTGQPAPTLAVPSSAVVNDGLRSFVFIQNGDGSFDRRLVRTGRADDRFIEVTDGLSVDDRIAVGGVSQLQTAFAALR